MTLLQILQAIDKISGKRKKRVSLPVKLILPAAWLMEKMAMVTNVEPRATVDSLRMAKQKMFYSSDKAIRELGYQYRPAAEALEDAMDWFLANGYCG